MSGDRSLLAVNSDSYQRLILIPLCVNCLGRKGDPGHTEIRPDASTDFRQKVAENLINLRLSLIVPFSPHCPSNTILSK